MGALIITLCILAALAVGIVIWWDTNRFHTVSYEIYSDKAWQPFHFVFLSDLHNKEYGENNERLIDAVDRLSPDAVLAGGDILTASPGLGPGVAAQLLTSLAKRYPVFYANGNHEMRLKLYPEKYGALSETYESALREACITRLVNEKRELGGVNVAITGCEIDRMYYKRLSGTRMEPDYLKQLLPERDESCFQILLAHNPDYFEAYAGWGADLVLSGHVHGGVARLPFLGGVISPRLTLFPKYDGGRFDLGRAVMIVSRGLGSHTIPVRFLNPGELVEVWIRPEKDKG